MREYYVYIMASRSGVLYTGVTSDLERRVAMHKGKMLTGFTARYNVTRLVHFEQTNDVHAALAREKQIKAWRRSKKIALIETDNPTWTDLAEEWGGAWEGED
jgi:putative endonuclease